MRKGLGISYTVKQRWLQGGIFFLNPPSSKPIPGIGDGDFHFVIFYYRNANFGSGIFMPRKFFVSEIFPGDRGYRGLYSQIFEFLSRELGFLIQLIGNILKSGDFYFGDSEFFLNLEIFIPGFLLLGLGIFENLGNFIPEIDHFFKSGDFYLRR